MKRDRQVAPGGFAGICGTANIPDAAGRRREPLETNDNPLTI